MINPTDKQTQRLELDEPKRGRGRPATGKAMTAAQKQKAYRERLKMRGNKLENALAEIEKLKGNVTVNGFTYIIKSNKGYWMQGGFGYTKRKAEAGQFSMEEMQELNLDGCTLEKV